MRASEPYTVGTTVIAHDERLGLFIGKIAEVIVWRWYEDTPTSWLYRVIPVKEDVQNRMPGGSTTCYARSVRPATMACEMCGEDSLETRIALCGACNAQV